MKIYIDVFLLGISLSWGPCLSFCAPITVPYIAATQKSWLEGLRVSLVFSLARIVSYVVLSLISATLGYYLIRRFYEEQQTASVIYIIAGAFVVLLGIIVLLGKSFRFPFCSGIEKIKATGIGEMALLGVLVGFAPCLPLLGLLVYIAFNAQNFLHGAALGLTFGLGTLISPLILFGPLAGGAAGLLFKKPLVYKIFSCICGVLLIYFGIALIIRVWQI